MSLLALYDPVWATRFTQIAAELRRHGSPHWVIEHIGSTAIPGLSAKPIIDVAVRLSGDDDLDRHRPALEALGWQVGSAVRSHPVMVFAENRVRTRIAHFFTAGQWDAVNQRILRDWLLQHPSDVARYERAKQDAAAAAIRGDAPYNAGKTAVIQAIVDQARAARGLAPVDVYDK